MTNRVPEPPKEPNPARQRFDRAVKTHFDALAALANLTTLPSTANLAEVIARVNAIHEALL